MILTKKRNKERKNRKNIKITKISKKLIGGAANPEYADLIKILNDRCNFFNEDSNSSIDYSPILTKTLVNVNSKIKAKIDKSASVAPTKPPRRKQTKSVNNSDKIINLYEQSRGDDDKNVIIESYSNTSLFYVDSHSSYEKYFEYLVVPSNCYICFISPLNYANIIFSDEKNSIETFIVEMNPLVYKNVFDLRAKLSENTMGCFNTESKRKDKNFFDCFENSTWYYPNQLFPNPGIDITEKDKGKITEYNQKICMNVTEIYLEDNKTKFMFHESDEINEILNGKSKGSYKDLYGRINKYIMSNNEKINIFIITGCRVIDFENEELFKYELIIHHINLKISEKYTKKRIFQNTKCLYTSTRNVALEDKEIHLLSIKYYSNPNLSRHTPNLIRIYKNLLEKFGEKDFDYENEKIISDMKFLANMSMNKIFLFISKLLKYLSTKGVKEKINFEKWLLLFILNNYDQLIKLPLRLTNLGLKRKLDESFFKLFTLENLLDSIYKMYIILFKFVNFRFLDNKFYDKYLNKEVIYKLNRMITNLEKILVDYKLILKKDTDDYTKLVITKYLLINQLSDLNLKKVKLSFFDSDVPILSNKIEVIEVNCNFIQNNLPQLNQFINLQNLKLLNIDNLHNLDFIQNFSHLKELLIKNCVIKNQINNLYSLKSLTLEKSKIILNLNTSDLTSLNLIRCEISKLELKNNINKIIIKIESSKLKEININTKHIKSFIFENYNIIDTTTVSLKAEISELSFNNSTINDSRIENILNNKITKLEFIESILPPNIFDLITYKSEIRLLQINNKCPKIIINPLLMSSFTSLETLDLLNCDVEIDLDIIKVLKICKTYYLEGNSYKDITYTPDESKRGGELGEIQSTSIFKELKEREIDFDLILGTKDVTGIYGTTLIYLHYD